MADLSHEVYYSKKDSKLKINATLQNLNNPEDASVINNIFFTAGYDDPNHVGVTITGSGVKDDLTAEMIESVQVSANTIFWEMRYESNTENNTVNGIINVSNADYLEYPFIFDGRKTVQQTEYFSSINNISTPSATVWFALMMYDQDEVLEDTPMNEIFESSSFDDSVRFPYSLNYRTKEIEQHFTDTMINSDATEQKDFYLSSITSNVLHYLKQNNSYNAKIVSYFGIFNGEQANNVTVGHSLSFINPASCALVPANLLQENFQIIGGAEANGVYKTAPQFQIGLANVANHYANNYFMEVDIDGEKIYQNFSNNQSMISTSSLEERKFDIRALDESGNYSSTLSANCMFNTVQKREFVREEKENNLSESNYPNQRIITFY